MHDQPPPPQGATAAGLCLAIVRSSFNRKYSEGLLAGAVRALQSYKKKDSPFTAVQCSNDWETASDSDSQGNLEPDNYRNIARYMVHTVPGALELPLAAQWLANEKEPDAIVALGVVLRGETPHFDYVSSCCLQGLTDVSLRTGIPVACGVLTVNTGQQAKKRSSKDKHNRGWNAMHAAVAMASLKKELLR